MIKKKEEGLAGRHGLLSPQASPATHAGQLTRPCDRPTSSPARRPRPRPRPPRSQPLPAGPRLSATPPTVSSSSPTPQPPTRPEADQRGRCGLGGHVRSTALSPLAPRLRYRSIAVGCAARITSHPPLEPGVSPIKGGAPNPSTSPHPAAAVRFALVH